MLFVLVCCNLELHIWNKKLRRPQIPQYECRRCLRPTLTVMQCYCHLLAVRWITTEVIFQPFQKQAAHVFQSFQKWNRLCWCVSGKLGEVYLFSECTRKNILDRNVSEGFYHFIFTLDALTVLVLLVSRSIEMNPVLHWCGVYEDIPAHEQKGALEFI